MAHGPATVPYRGRGGPKRTAAVFPGSASGPASVCEVGGCQLGPSRQGGCVCAQHARDATCTRCARGATCTRCARGARVAVPAQESLRSRLTLRSNNRGEGPCKPGPVCTRKAVIEQAVGEPKCPCECARAGGVPPPSVGPQPASVGTQLPSVGPPGVGGGEPGPLSLPPPPTGRGGKQEAAALLPSPRHPLRRVDAEWVRKYPPDLPVVHIRKGLGVVAGVGVGVTELKYGVL